MSRAEEIAYEVYPDYSPDGKCLVKRYVERAFFKNGYEQAEKDTIERACKWLFSHLPILVDYYNEDIHTNADRSEFIKLFRTQMEEE